LKTYLLG